MQFCCMQIVLHCNRWQTKKEDRKKNCDAADGNGDEDDCSRSVDFGKRKVADLCNDSSLFLPFAIFNGEESSAFNNNSQSSTKK